MFYNCALSMNAEGFFMPKAEVKNELDSKEGQENPTEESGIRIKDRRIML